MFESLALENPRSTMRNWTTALSFTLQTAGLSLLVLAPIGYTQAVAPKISEPLEVPSGITRIETQSPPETTRPLRPTPPFLMRDGQLVYSPPGGRIPIFVDASQDSASVDPNVTGIVGGTNIGTNNPMDRLLAVMKPATNVGPPANTRPKPYAISHLDPGMLIKQVQPAYPTLAKAAHIQGKVILLAVVDTQGRITQLRAMSGHPLLIKAAIDAVQQWRYRPYILNDQAVAVETQITVNFTLQN